MGETPRFRGFRVVSIERAGGLEQVAGVCRSGRCRRLLTYDPNGRNGGTVEPPCDFQMSYCDFPLFKGVPARFSSRDARGRAPPQAHDGLILVCRWLVCDLNPIF